MIGCVPSARPSTAIKATVTRPFSKMFHRPSSSAIVKPPSHGWFYCNLEEESLITQIRSRPHTPSAPLDPPALSHREAVHKLDLDGDGQVDEHEFEAYTSANRMVLNGAAHVCIQGMQLHTQDGSHQYKGVNGEYQRSDDRTCNGRAVYIKMGKPSIAMWWANNEGKVSWCVGPADSIGKRSMWAYVESMGRGPEEAGSRPWYVYSYSSAAWEEQQDVQVLNLDKDTEDGAGVFPVRFFNSPSHTSLPHHCARE